MKITSLLWGHVYIEHSQSVQYFAHSFTTCQVINTIASMIIYTRKMNTLSNETCLNGTHQCLGFPHIVQIYLNAYWHITSNLNAAIAASVVKKTHRPSLFHQQHFLVHKQTSYTNVYCWSCKTFVTTRCISEWMAFVQSHFFHRKRITECCSLRDAFNNNVAILILYKWCHSNVTEIKLTAVTQN